MIWFANSFEHCSHILSGLSNLWLWLRPLLSYSFITHNSVWPSPADLLKHDMTEGAAMSDCFLFFSRIQLITHYYLMLGAPVEKDGPCFCGSQHEQCGKSYIWYLSLILNGFKILLVQFELHYDLELGLKHCCHARWEVETGGKDLWIILLWWQR